MTDQPTTDDEQATREAERIDHLRLLTEFGELPKMVAALHADRNNWVRNAITALASRDAASQRWLDVSMERDQLKAERDEAVAHLEEATAVIILSQRALGIDHPAWVVLDGYDGSRDACREVEALGFTRSGKGGWFVEPPTRVEPLAHPADGTPAELSGKQDGTAS